MANIARFDPFNELVDDLFKGFFVRPMKDLIESGKSLLILRRPGIDDLQADYADVIDLADPRIALDHDDLQPRVVRDFFVV